MILALLLSGCAEPVVDTADAEFSFESPKDGETVVSGDTIASTILMVPHGDKPGSFRVGWVANNQPDACLGTEFDKDGVAECGVIAAGNDDGKMQFYAHIMNASMTKGRLQPGPLVYVEAAPVVTPPVVHLEPDTPNTDDDLHIVIDEPAICPGGEAPIDTFAWTQDHVQVATVTDTLSHTETAKGEEWSGVVTSTCAEDYGASNADVVIANAAPVVGKPTVSVEAGGASATCTPAGAVSDADGDPLTETYAWKADSVDVVGEGSTLTLEPTAATVECASVASDGDAVTIVWSDVVTVVR